MNTSLGRATRTENWKPQDLLALLVAVRSQLENMGEHSSLEMLTLELLHNVFTRTDGSREEDAKRIRYSIARLLHHLHRHGDELPTRLHLSFDAAVKALEVDVIH